MANFFRGRGNLGATPTLRHAQDTPVANLRVYFDRPIPNGEGGFNERGGFWANVSLWGSRAETAARLLPKGTRVAVEGELFESQWVDKETGEERRQLEIRARHVDPDLGRIDSLTIRRRHNAQEENTSDSDGAVANAPGSANTS
ncbi:single-stranded DNA-binding protein [Halorhodospira sp. 9622]|uniref:single-stranded DNA-binding protein n=1 Tax=Halorhodospira sp. 9622 TaxID=2899136 RepID=UPI001EE9673A|nr:single-stranded DNA-binding protein [Halorhodospira sp. 9622]MCG5537330.1 single-stranded DNA-binding protein [Halorhodospira sp. 9622]